ncbi:hypothetical protein FNF29_05305 [Cafeteria roenbergensis]|uniref:Ion transport domain-containing protein n=1 Tax=Cafeteria roenbergensis TaxID=33653 RepID=A0A5A8CFY8_CAFRO|nr:hypothetical protein FNF29_05305 [Cafeteria roenbergensis]KAA0151962.1 hypothetical protein FNF31_06721 [Cafeteria roenbergensis]|eukprot:KAA0150292.1 hypothetical protein FNF29_05305 [Cafeteria roenbergensis]
MSRLVFLAVTPGFALDAFLLTPGILHLAGVADIFEPGRPTQLVVVLRVLRLVRAFKLLRYTPGSQQLLTVVQGKLEALVTSLLICFSFSLVLASGVFAAEFGTNPEFSSMLGAVWFAVVTVTTVGFGDVVPETSFGRVCGALLALTGTALYALPPAIVATGYLEHRDLDRRAKMAAFEKLFDRKRGLVLRSAFHRLRARAKNATRLLAKALRRQHAAEAEAMRAMAAGEPVDGRGRNLDATELELITAQKLFQQRSPGSLGGHSTDGSEATMAGKRGADTSHSALPYPLRQDSTRRGFMGQSGRTGFHGSSGRGGLVGEYGRGVPSFVSHSTARTNSRVTSAAKALLIACKGELSAGIRALVDAERWAVSPEAAGDDTSLPDLVRLQTHNHALLD